MDRGWADSRRRCAGSLAGTIFARPDGVPSKFCRITFFQEDHMDTARKITHAHPYAPSDLYRYLGSQGYPLVIDVRKPAAFDSDEQMLPAAVRVAPEHIYTCDPTHPPPLATYFL